MRKRRGEALAAVLAGATSLGGAFAPADAQTDDIAADDYVYVEADEVVDNGSGRYTARGRVEARYGERVLRADEVIFLPEEGRVIARGGVTIIEDSGAVSFAEEAELSDDLTEGVIADFAARLENNVRIGARVATRTPDDSVRLTRAFYTACEACGDSGLSARPSWRLRARKVTRDAPNDLIYYRDAVLEVKGLPVLYTPFFAHADPSAGRKSGFLLPSFGSSTRTGLFYEQPYYWVVSDSTDLTIAPRLIEDVAPLVGFEFRKRFFSGNVNFTGSVTNEQEFGLINVEVQPIDPATGEPDPDAEPVTRQQFTEFGEERIRGHLFGQGLFAVTDNWSWGFGLEGVLNDDDLYLRRYEIPDSRRRRGLFQRTDRRLLTQLFTVRQSRDAYFSAAALDFQSLREEQLVGGVLVDEEDTFPIVAPFSEARKTFRTRFIGGRTEVRASAVALERDTGVDYRRFSLEGEWNRRIITPQGLVIEPTALARGDAYSFADAPVTASAPLVDGLDGGEVEDRSLIRGLGYAGTTVSLPFGRRFGRAQLVVEPIANVTYASEDDRDEEIVNQDSLSVDLDEAGVFAANRSPGFDVWEEGGRVTAGGRGSVRWGPDQQASVFVAQSYRADEFAGFNAIAAEDADDETDASGLRGDMSDIVASGRLQLNARNNVEARVRISDEEYDVQRLDVEARVGLGPASGFARYLQFDEEAASDRPLESLDVGGSFRVTKNVSLYYNESRDLEENTTRRSDAGVVYRDNCTEIQVAYRRQNFDDSLLGTEESFTVRFTLATLGGVSSQ